MAIDSEDKRRSALLEGILPVADGSVDTQDRPHAVWIYRGITISTTEALIDLTLRTRTLTLTLPDRDDD